MKNRLDKRGRESISFMGVVLNVKDIFFCKGSVIYIFVRLLLEKNIKIKFNKK